MKYLLSLAIPMVASALCLAGPLDYPFDSRSAGEYYGYEMWDETLFPGLYGYDAPGPPSAEHSTEMAGSSARSRPWVPATSQRPEPDFSSYESNGVFPSYRHRDNSAGLYEQFRPRPGGPRYSGQMESETGLSGYQHSLDAFNAQPYRFRDDNGGNESPKAWGTWHRGYRFRPLTEQERERKTARPGWRPMEENRRVPRAAGPSKVDPEMPQKYGFETAPGFGRYFADPQ